MRNFFNTYQLDRIRSSKLSAENLASLLDIPKETVRAVRCGQNKPAIRGAKNVGVSILRTRFATAWQANKALV